MSTWSKKKNHKENSWCVVWVSILWREKEVEKSKSTKMKMKRDQSRRWFDNRSTFGEVGSP